MTNWDKARLADYLFDEIGLIRDDFVAEAERPYERKARALSLRRMVVVGVSLTLTLTAVLGVWIGNRMAGRDEAADEIGNAVVTQQSESTAPVGISLRLQELREATEDCVTPKEKVELFSGTAQIVWKYADEDTYRVRRLSAAETDRLLPLLNRQENASPVSGEASDGTAVAGIWITLGDGRVISPCLKPSDGNVGYGELFDYEPEIEPTDELTELICDVLS